MVQIEELLIIVKKILKQTFSPTVLIVEDESHLHIGHTGHGGARHLYIKIHAKALHKLARVAAHRAIYHALAVYIPKEIHALRIMVLRDLNN